MHENKLDHLLETFFAEQSDKLQLEKDKNIQLSMLERKVWNKIEQRKKIASQTPIPVLLNLFQPFRTVPFQLATLVFALSIGILASSLYTLPTPREQNITQLDMSIFTVKSHYLAANLIERTQ